MKWWEFDLTRYTIWTLEKLHLAWNVVWPEPEKDQKTEEEVSADEAGTMLITSADRTRSAKSAAACGCNFGSFRKSLCQT